MALKENELFPSVGGFNAHSSIASMTSPIWIPALWKPVKNGAAHHGAKRFDVFDLIFRTGRIILRDARGDRPAGCQRGKALDERIDKLVGAIGELIRRIPPQSLN